MVIRRLAGAARIDVQMVETRPGDVRVAFDIGA
jgi:hypothetical protein